jgi:hypothetical protein
VRRLVGIRRAQVAGEPLESGEAISDTGLKQALDIWIEHIEDVERQRTERATNRSNEQLLNRQMAAQERDNMRTRQVDRITREEDADISEDSSITDTPNVLATPTPATSNGVVISANTNSSRKRRRTADGAAWLASVFERYVDFKTSQDLETANNEDGRIQRLEDSISDRFRRLEGDMAEIKGLLAQIARGRDS